MASITETVARRLPPLPTIGDILRIYGIRAKKNLSQNFILDPRILKKFAKTAGNLNNKYVVEVGPGPGGITRAVLDAGAKEVHVIEKDSRFLPSLQLLQEAAGGNKLHINIGDCLNYNPVDTFSDSLAKEWNTIDEPNLILVGNLPFNVATPLLLRLLEAMHTKSNIYTFGRVPAVLTFQHEVAHRMAAPPGDPERSRLSVVSQNWAEVDYIYNLPGGAFVPPPDVQVGIVRITPLKEPYITGLSFPFINKVVTAIFSGKQKHLKNALGYGLFPKQDQYLSSQLLESAGVPNDEKAINLNMDEIGRICYAYKYLLEEQSQISGTNKLENYTGSNLSNISSSDETKKAVREEEDLKNSGNKPTIQFDIRL